MIALTDALDIILSMAKPLEIEDVDICAADGRVLAQNINSTFAVPSFDSSLFDGVACRSGDTHKARPNCPVSLKLIGAIGAGESFEQPLTSDTCIRIMTGAPLPADADAVIPAEKTVQSEQSVLIYEPVNKGENVSRAGADIPGGVKVLSSGTLLSPAHLAVIAAVGSASLRVYRKPQAGILAAGSELTAAGKRLGKAKIYDSNSVMTASLAAGCGAVIAVRETVEDKLDRLAFALDNALSRCDIIITTGGVSSGDYDLTGEAVMAAGAKIVLRGVDIKPGGAMLVAERQGKLIFSLTGKPTGAWVTFNLLVRSALFSLQGRQNCELPMLQAVLEYDTDNQSTSDLFMPSLTLPRQNVWTTAAAASKYPGSLYPLCMANSLLCVPAKASLKAGETVIARLLPPFI
ncbi:MAG: molybdopterin molybdotransferase MoeA [Dethiobacter sp.]|jgi:molybdopterin molybdotransferase|nr:molybdopterin molybdotransferase MoeA [Dethiobacter sp.]